jgi:radical SAM superfamily enzyme YgiQ (UPF0313 family)
MNDKKLIFLADLTHTGTIISSNVHPLGIGLIAAYLLKNFSDDIEVELFKYPADLSSALEKRKPHIMGFANYSWNLNLSYEYAKRIKRHYPDTTIVFGGPNYGMEKEEIWDFWQRYSLIDFYIVREGELAMVEFFRALQFSDFDGSRLRKSKMQLPNCHYISDGQVVEGEILPRIDLAEIPSPYLTGIMDKFFDHSLMPLIHTSRGCPFQCTYCCEGAKYYQKVKHKMDIEEELQYIAKRVVGRPELFISDANFGMYLQDIEKARSIARVQDKYGFPNYIHVSSGKNQKERIIEVATIVKGAMRSVAAALQSTDPTVLEKVKRSNISQDSLKAVSQHAVTANVDTYTEIILGLPGDNVKAHIQTLRDVVEADLGIVRMYQLILLPQTELNAPESRKEYGIKGKYRIMPRSFGKYSLKGEEFLAVECEEICVETNTLTFEEYIQCRELNLTVEIIHNGRTFQELKGVCKWLGISWFDFILRFHNKRYSYDFSLAQLYRSFREGTVRVWDTEEQLEQYVHQNIENLLSDQEGTNEMSRAKSIAFFQLIDVLHDILYEEMVLELERKGYLNNTIRQYLKELKEYSLLRKKDIIDVDVEYTINFHFDFPCIMGREYSVDPEDYMLPKPVNYRISHNNEQKDMIRSCINEYGTTIDGLSRIIMFRVHYKKLFRDVQVKKNPNS